MFILTERSDKAGGRCPETKKPAGAGGFIVGLIAELDLHRTLVSDELIMNDSSACVQMGCF